MNRTQRAFCRTVLLLEYIPAVRRVYILDFDAWVEAGGDHESFITETHWEWMWRGLWGFNLLSRWGLLWPYIDHGQPWSDNDHEEFMIDWENTSEDNPSSEA